MVSGSRYPARDDVGVGSGGAGIGLDVLLGGLMLCSVKRATVMPEWIPVSHREVIINVGNGRFNSVNQPFRYYGDIMKLSVTTPGF